MHSAEQWLVWQVRHAEVTLACVGHWTNQIKSNLFPNAKAVHMHIKSYLHVEYHEGK